MKLYEQINKVMLQETKETANGLTHSENVMDKHADKMSALAANDSEHNNHQDNGESIETHINQHRLHLAAAAAHNATGDHIQKRVGPDAGWSDHNYHVAGQHEDLAEHHLQMAKAKHAANTKLLGGQPTAMKESKEKYITSYHPSVN